MLKKLFSKKESISLIGEQETDVVLRLMFEIAISDGRLDAAELELIKKRAREIADENEKVSSIIKSIMDETKSSTSLYPTVKKINDTHSMEEKIELLNVLWGLVAADQIIDAYEENLYFKIADLIKVKRSQANQIKQKNL